MEIKMYTSEKYGYVCEIWGSSTKHADTTFLFSDFNSNEYIEPRFSVFQWLLECASKMYFPSTAREIAELAMKEWYPNKEWTEPKLPNWELF